MVKKIAKIIFKSDSSLEGTKVVYGKKQPLIKPEPSNIQKSDLIIQVQEPLPPPLKTELNPIKEHFSLLVGQKRRYPLIVAIPADDYDAIGSALLTTWFSLSANYQNRSVPVVIVVPEKHEIPIAYREALQCFEELCKKAGYNVNIVSIDEKNDGIEKVIKSIFSAPVPLTKELFSYLNLVYPDFPGVNEKVDSFIARIVKEWIDITGGGIVYASIFDHHDIPVGTRKFEADSFINVDNAEFPSCITLLINLYQKYAPHISLGEVLSTDSLFAQNNPLAQKVIKYILNISRKGIITDYYARINAINEKALEFVKNNPEICLVLGLTEASSELQSLENFKGFLKIEGLNTFNETDKEPRSALAFNRLLTTPKGKELKESVSGFVQSLEVLRSLNNPNVFISSFNKVNKILKCETSENKITDLIKVVSNEENTKEILEDIETKVLEEIQKTKERRIPFVVFQIGGKLDQLVKKAFDTGITPIEIRRILNQMLNDIFMGENYLALIPFLEQKYMVIGSFPNSSNKLSSEIMRQLLNNLYPSEAGIGTAGIRLAGFINFPEINDKDTNEISEVFLRHNEFLLQK